MIYYSLSYFKSKYGSVFEWNNASSFTSNLNNDERNFLNHLEVNNALIFLSWIDGMNGLKQLLENGSTSIPFKDELKLLNHSLVNDFKRFITPMLGARLRSFKSINDGNNSFGYLVLLENDTRGVVEDQLYNLIVELFNEVQLLKNQKVTEDILIQAIQKPVNDQVINVVNAFSRQSYALKLKYVDAVLAIINAESCTIRLANWLFKQLQKLELNEEHKYKINDLKSDLKTGILQVKNTNSRKRTEIPLRTVLLYSGIFFLMVLVFWIIAFKPFSESDKPQLTNNSSYKKFTQEERRQIDSMLRIIQPSRQLAPESSDLGTYLGEELDLVLRVPFINEIAEQYYNDIHTYLQNYDSLKPDSCLKVNQSDEKLLLPRNMTFISEKKVGNPAYFKNEASYDVQIIVFKDLLKSPVYYGFIAEGKTASILLQTGDSFVVVPGNYLSNFEKPHGYSGALPSNEFNIRFCEIDINLLHGINSSYTLDASKRINYKFLLVGSPTEQFEVIDIHGVLSVE